MRFPLLGRKLVALADAALPRLLLVAIVGLGVLLGVIWLFVNPRRYKMSIEKQSQSRAPVFSSSLLVITLVIFWALVAVYLVARFTNVLN
jgi:hypothetical protein